MSARPHLRRPSWAVNAVLVLALGGGGFWAYETVTGPDTGAAADASVRTVPVQQGTVTASVTADGTVASARTASAGFATSGTVTAISVKVGDTVKKGQTLAKVDAAPAERDLAAAEADLDAAQDALDRAEDADSDTSSAENAVDQARLAVDEAQAAVDGTVLEAPMAGTVVAVNGTLGSTSSASGAQGQGEEAATGFIDLVDLTELLVTADFAEADATKLKEKQAATVTWNALSGTEQAATVTAVDPQATTTNDVVTYGVTLTLAEVPKGAKPGQTVSVAVTTGTAEDAVYVSSAAVTTAGNRHTVTVVADGVQEVRTVQIGLEGDRSTQITEGVQPGEQLVVATSSTTTGTGPGGFPGGGLGGLTGGGAPPGGGAAPGGAGRGGR